MTKTHPSWALGAKLDIGDADGGLTLLDRVKHAIVDGIRAGRLSPGSKMPPSRRLAIELGCSRGVVVRAYTELIAAGVLEARPGAATVVRERGESEGRTTPATAPTPRGAPDVRYNFTPGVADLRIFPRAQWHGAVRHVMDTIETTDLDYPEPNGSHLLREALATRLARVRGITTSADHVLVSSGTVHGLSLVARTLALLGHTHIAVEEPGWNRMYGALTAAGLALTPIRVDADGLVVDDLARQPDVRAVLVTPAHQFPTGCIMSEERRQDLCAWARRSDGLILEDDYDAEFNFERRPVSALQPVAPEHVLYLGTTSKILSPALRLGWVVTPKRLVEPLARLRPTYDLGVSAIDQWAMAHLITTGVLDRHLFRTRARYEARRAAMVNALRREAPAVVVSGAAAGLHVLATLPPGRDENVVVRQAARRHVRVLALGDFALTRQSSQALVLGYASLREESIDDGVRLLAEAIDAS